MVDCSGLGSIITMQGLGWLNPDSVWEKDARAYRLSLRLWLPQVVDIVFYVGSLSPPSLKTWPRM